MNSSSVRASSSIPFGAALSAALVTVPLPAQDTTTSRLRAGVEFGLGVTTRVQAISDVGLGPVATIALRQPAGSRRAGFVVGASYTLIPLTRRLPDGSANNSAVEGVHGVLGAEWTFGDATRFDMQWNPAIANVRRWGAQPASRRPTPMQHTLSAASVGVRFGKPGARIGYALRLHTTLNPMAFLGEFYPSLQVMVRP